MGPGLEEGGRGSKDSPLKILFQSAWHNFFEGEVKSSIKDGKQI